VTTPPRLSNSRTAIDYIEQLSIRPFCRVKILKVPTGSREYEIITHVSRACAVELL
jgi:hypothetical protein